MRVASLSVGVLLILGCRSAPEQQPQAETGGRRVTAEVVGENPATERPSTQPVQSLRGRILTVNPQLRFVIVDFPAQKLPVLDQKLGVWRMDHKVAEIKISGPYRGSTVAADITAGEVKPGDMVRREW